MRLDFNPIYAEVGSSHSTGHISHFSSAVQSKLMDQTDLVEIYQFGVSLFH